MRHIVIASALFLVGGISQVAAQTPLVCEAGESVVSANDVIAATVCVGSLGNWEGQEYHVAGGELWDFKGGNDPKNKSEQVGTWSNSGDIFTYTYGPSSEFVTLYCRRADSTIYFKNNAGRVQDVIFKGAGSGCD